MPAIIGMTVISLYPLIDGIFTGNIIGQTAMTACGVATTLTIFNNGVATLSGLSPQIDGMPVIRKSRYSLTLHRLFLKVFLRHRPIWSIC